MCDYCVVDLDTGTRINAPNKLGELLVRTPLALSHYWNKQAATEETLISLNGEYGWLRTGDIAEIDAEGFVFIRDRAKDIIIRGGENISCSEVEAAFFASNPGIMECACFGVKDARLGETVGVMVHMKPGQQAAAADLVASTKGRLAAFKLPPVANVFFSSSPLPRGDTGKTLKRAIRDAVNAELKAGRRVTHRAKL